MAISLYQSALLAEQNGETKKAGVLMTFAQSQLLGAMPIVNIQGNSFAWTRTENLGTTAFRAVGGSYTASNGAVSTRHAELKIMGGDLDVDKFLVRTHGPQIRSTHEQMKAMYMAQSIAYQIIKGSVVTAGGATGDANGFDGLQTRYGGGFGSTAVVDAGENAAQIIANDGASDALSMKKLDEAIQLCEGASHIILPKKMKVNITALLRNSSSITTGRDEFGRLVTSYNGLPFIEADHLGLTSGLEPLGFNENNDSTTSLYVVNMSDMGLHMIQNGGVDVTDLGEIDTSPVFRTRVEWYCNMVDLHPRCVVRLYNVADLTAVA